MSNVLGGYIGKRENSVVQAGKGIVTLQKSSLLNGGVLHQQSCGISIEFTNFEVPNGAGFRNNHFHQSKISKIAFEGLNLHPDAEAFITGATKTTDTNILTASSITTTLSGGSALSSGNQVVELTDAPSDYHDNYQIEVYNSTDDVMLTRGDLATNKFEIVVKVTSSTDTSAIGDTATQGDAEGVVVDIETGTPNEYYIRMTKGNFVDSTAIVVDTGSDIASPTVAGIYIIYDDTDVTAGDTVKVTYLKEVDSGYVLTFDSNLEVCNTVDIVVSFRQINQNTGCFETRTDGGVKYYTWELTDCVREEGMTFDMPNGEQVTFPFGFTVNGKTIAYPAI
jgi:hypothetical protein